MAYQNEEERRKKYDEVYIEWLDRFVKLRKLRNVKRDFVAKELGLKYRTYYKKEVCVSSFTLTELIQAFEVIGFKMDIISGDIFTHNKKGNRIEY